MTINWWSWLPPWAQRLLSAIPSVIVEFVSGVLMFALSWGAAKLCWNARWWFLDSLEPLHSVPGLAIIIFFAHILSAIYEALMDPNGWEWKDLLQRELGILAAAVVWWVWW